MSAEQKKRLRSERLALRDALSPAWREDASAQAARVAFKALDVSAAQSVAGFLPIRSEIDPRPLLRLLSEVGSSLALPVVIDTETMVFRRWSFGDPLVELAFNTKGPAADAAEVMPDVVILPLSAFDRNGNRIGYGGGFYDRALARMAARGHHPRLIGMAFACQEVEHVPAEPHDLPITEIITENGWRVLQPQ